MEVQLGKVRRENAKLLSKLLLKVHPREEKLHLEKNKMKLTHFVFNSTGASTVAGAKKRVGPTQSLRFDLEPKTKTSSSPSASVQGSSASIFTTV